MKKLILVLIVISWFMVYNSKSSSAVSLTGASAKDYKNRCKIQNTLNPILYSGLRMIGV